jgi:hypothetical protein
MTVTEVPEETALYRVFGEADLLLYIGISKDFGARWKQHARRQPWWPEKRRMTTQWFGSRPEAEEAETAAIKAEGPKYNFTHAVPPRPRQRKAAKVPARRPVLIKAPDLRQWMCPDSPDGFWTADAWHEHMTVGLEASHRGAA